MIEILEWDTVFFGRKIGRLAPVPSDERRLREELSEASALKFQYLACRLAASEISAVQLLEKHAFYLTDLGVAWELSPGQKYAVQPRVREGNRNDCPAVGKLATGLFPDGRFYADPFFSREEADRLYQVWAENSLKGHADKVFLLEEKGFIACRLSAGHGEILLVGVGVPFQGHGIGKALLQAALGWFQSMGATTVTVRTQAGNRRAMRFYEQNGFQVKAADITMARVFAG